MNVTTEKKANTIGFTELKKWLRHRHPMIYIDRVLDYEPSEYFQCMMSVSGTMDCIAGHFPERAIFPGTHLTQCFAQAGIVFYQLSTSPLEEDELTLIGSVKARFLKVIVPGDQVIFNLKCEGIQDNNNTFIFSCRATVDGKPVAAFKGTLVRTKIDTLGEQLW
ncbi:beta-hydroxyacyl-ACP dehydratase [Bacillus cereus]|uniref:Beta-hydroxyacyl-ACP dehydratase n=1 Tax=Bacillus cereus TaxID=1396 RepID=A0A9X6Z7T2_BACCE|nr:MULTISPECIES: beta-hydroxyacyl-ACP dehydratase [Bacillus cereus group]PGK36907.1 beta-hydroxyacyl-ACP dehydratase [Bacillus anthracis]HDR6315061.1 beta-hydroxyacyl-ACP dehydratase [Bacillus thuringiensis]MED3394090.1 beta-hydroxyacyl-ACP dehydratase [Bacillus wiedmannii]PFB30163.1 beta-hydroxyacyl-ACP dehydratase [Bacillus cereus]PFC08094.1 beta-hydroxyacyl-ACP dehydratase [Bacillus cereus]